MHGIEGEQAPGQAEGGDQILGGGDFVALIVDRQVAENDLVIAGECAQHMGRLAVVEGIKAAAQRLAVNGHASRLGRVPLVVRRCRQSSRVLAEHGLDRGRVQAVDDEAHRRVPQAYGSSSLRSDQTATNRATISGPRTNPFMPINESPPTVEMSTA